MAPNLLVAQSGGPTAVINASLAGLVSAAQDTGGFKRVLGLRHGILGALPGGAGYLDLAALDAARLIALADTPSAALGSCRRKLDADDCAAVIEWFRHHGIHDFAYIGGNDSMQTCLQLGQAAQDIGYELSVIGVPKTIDNDLPETDHCPGYGSAARFWAITTQEVALDLAAMRGYDTVVVLECMGRNAGWLTAAAALGRPATGDPPGAAPHILLVPEVPLVLDQVLASVEAAVSRHGRAVVVAAETVRTSTGDYLSAAADASGALPLPPSCAAGSAPGLDMGEDDPGRLDQSAGGHGGHGGTGRPEHRQSDAFGHPLVTGTADSLANRIGVALGVKTRTVKPGTLQRAASSLVSTVDRDEAWQVGAAAARLLAAGRRGVMVTLQAERDPAYRSWCAAVSLVRVAGVEKTLPGSFLAVQPGGVCNVTAAFADYARPLLGGPLPDFVRL